MSRLNAEQRAQLPASAFVFPKDKRYPIPDRGHAMAAIKDSAGTADEAAVREAVCRKFGIGCNH